jgi:type VI secretion system protein ImpG
MDPRLRQYYSDELKHLRDMGVEFAQQFPKIAKRLGMSELSGIEVADPYVERLLEGVAFLAARVQLKLDAEFPRFTQALLEIIYPHYLAPTPSMLVAEIKPDPGEPNLARGFTIPRGSPMHAAQVSEDATACEFRTAHDVTLWPIEVVSASYFSFAPDLPLASLPFAQRVKGGIRIRLRSTAGVDFSQMTLDRLRFHLTGHDDVIGTLYELCLGAGLGGLALPPVSPAPWVERLAQGDVQPVGFDDAEALLPVTLRSFQGYRLLQEYFAFPHRYYFFDVCGLRQAVTRAKGKELELVWLFSRGNPELERVVDASNFTLFCTPAINLFEKRVDRINVTPASHEYHVVPDRTRPQDFEVYRVTDVVGYGAGADNDQSFRPFYSTWSADEEHTHTAFFTTRRERRLDSEAQKRRGTRSSYKGTEVFLSLVDSDQAPFRGDLRQLSVQALCTNRDLVLQMPIGGGKHDLGLDVAAPVTGVRIVSRASRPLEPLVDGGIAWRAISHFSLNYLSLTDSTPQQGAAALRDLLELYASGEDATARRQIEGLRSVQVGRVVRRLPGPGPIAFGRGLEVSLSVDTLAFEGGSPFLFGSVLNQYLRRYVSLNSFTETVLRSDSRGEINRWVPQWGARPTL